LKRIYVEKKEQFATVAKGVLSDIQSTLQLTNVENIRLINCYDIDGISQEDFEKSIDIVFSEPPVDNIYYEMPKCDNAIVVEMLPGQYDQRADSTAQCIQLLTAKPRVQVKSSKIYIIEGKVSAEDLAAIKNYLINPVECFEGTSDLPTTLDGDYKMPEPPAFLDEFNNYNDDQLEKMLAEYGLAMDFNDLKMTQDYFKSENRPPSVTEIRVLDTYWSDHCRHTTFLTELKNVEIEEPEVKATYEEYLKTRQELGIKKPVCLMDLATIAAKKLKKDGKLLNLDESEEINACSVKIKVDIDGNDEDWVLMFKNETHNHPTEIEPFGGAATCLGGAIRDPLSGRSYVYQAMRVTGAANPLAPIKDTISGKLPQRKICITAANGYSSYGNQIGLATGFVKEIYHPGYAAKRLETGAVLGAAPEKNIRRERPDDGDIVILLGGKTGRDGCGGATGSSKAHNSQSLENCGAEVQKGNPPEERKLQRLFRNSDVTAMIKRCNDFGAGGVSVAIGELADGLDIYLDRVPKKYLGLDATELAISESQERMAVVVAPNDKEKFIKEANKENLEATVVATVTNTNRLRMYFENSVAVDISRDFLNTNGAPKYADVLVKNGNNLNKIDDIYCKLSNCSQKGLIERFDSTIGAGSVFAPFGGKFQSTPAQVMVAKIPVLKGETSTVSVMSYGFNPFLTEENPYKGAMFAVIESVAKIVAAGGRFSNCYLTFQEYFERLKNEPKRWGKPLSALLGAFKAQTELEIASIGGKDSMSGSFEDLDVPPTLISFAVTSTKIKNITDNVFKNIGSNVICVAPIFEENGLPNWKSLKETFNYIENLIRNGRAKSVLALDDKPIEENIAMMCFGNKLGVEFVKDFNISSSYYGCFVVEINGEILENEVKIGTVIDNFELKNTEFSLTDFYNQFKNTLEPVFPARPKQSGKKIPKIEYNSSIRLTSPTKFAKPRVLIPVFPGTNCEDDTARAFEKAGAIAEIVVIKNLTAEDVAESVKVVEKKLENSQILMFPGGFSGGDEPEGSAKLINAFFRNPALKQGLRELLNTRKGLILGICNGFQALIKLGLVPFGDIVPFTENSPTLTFNSISRHQSLYVNTKICSNMSPWLSLCNVGDVHTVPVSHGEGRFIVSDDLSAKLIQSGQIATQYVDFDNEPTYDICYNPNNSYLAAEGITSPDGRVFGKMAHSERLFPQAAKNIAPLPAQPIFSSGVAYFS
jgi:phosphoribosylformylglycinamidine synthase